MKRRRANGKAPPAWTPLERCADYVVDKSGRQIPVPADVQVFKNHLYTVMRRRVPSSDPEAPKCWWLSIKRNDKGPAHDWRHFQRIKNELVGAEAEGVELYPAESRVVDTANQYHLWVFEDMRFPFGYSQRLVSESEDVGNRQRPFDEKPADLKSADDIKAMHAAFGLTGDEL